MIDIVTNKHGYRILVCDEPVWVEFRTQYKAGDFDGVFINIPFANDVELILKGLNPITCNKAAYKPFFAARTLKDKIGIYDEMFDAYIDSVDEELVLKTFKELENYRKEYDVPQETGAITNHGLLILRIFRYYISRNKLILEPKVMEKSAMGCALPLAECLHSWSLFHINEYFSWIDMGVAHGTLAYRKTVYRMHVCPKCQHSHLIYQEQCPNCGSNELDYEPVIHHFPCANISPEHTYIVGGQLICPKCHKPLRHIGIDYDRPTSLYLCHNCHQSFLTPDTTARCTYCGTVSNVNDLFPRSIHVVEITPRGINAICHGVYSFSPYNDYFNNYMPVEAFENRLQMIATRSLAHDGVIRGLMIALLWATDENGGVMTRTEKVVEAASRLFVNNKVTATNFCVYVQSTILEDEGEHAREQFRKKVSDNAAYMAMFLQPYTQLHIAFKAIGNNVEEDRLFVKEWSLIPSTSDITIRYEEVPHPKDMSTMMFISHKLNATLEDGQTEEARRLADRERMRQEIDELQDRPPISKLLSYLKWGYIVLAIVAVIAIIAGYWFWLR